MRILGIESSCDETALALVEHTASGFMTQKSGLASQVDIHAAYGGVVPELAAREHVRASSLLLSELGIARDGSDVDVIAVTAGPGLVPSLRVGVELAKTLAWVWEKPLVPVNHLEGHIYSVWLETDQPPEFPALCLLVSGGHTELILMKDHGAYELIGRTRDDAAGEAFDKVASLLKLPYPGGPEISKAAFDGNSKAIIYPRPMLESGDFDFSFSGLKTAVRRSLEESPDLSVSDVAASFQEAVVDVLIQKTLRAVKETGVKSVILSGGVSANRVLRERLGTSLSQVDPACTFHVPSLSLTGDNAVMIAACGAQAFLRGQQVSPFECRPDPNMKLADL